MNRFQTLRIVLLMLLLAAASVAAYLFFRHELYFCLLFSWYHIFPALSMFIVTGYVTLTENSTNSIIYLCYEREEFLNVKQP